MAQLCITEHSLQTTRHTTFFLAAGPEDGPLIIFIHGWPECSLSWRHQLPFFSGMGFRAVAPDMRGYGKSSVYPEHQSYAQKLIIEDMLELLDSLGHEQAMWVGHDWGSTVVWNMANHHADRCYGVASLCVPYATIERGLDALVALVDRTVYPIDKYPLGQWDYMRFYEERFAQATAEMDANPRHLVQLLFRKGAAAKANLPAALASIRQNGGWFGGLPEAPEIPRDDDVISEDELAVYAHSLRNNGFFGPNSWYMNHNANTVYFAEAINNGVIEMPALFIAARYDYVCESINARLAEPMRQRCRHLTEVAIDSGHWMAQEKPFEVNRELVRWLVNEVPDIL